MSTSRPRTRSTSPAPTQIWIALPFFIFGFLHLAGAVIWLACDPTLLTGHFYRPPVIAFAHAIGLGFLMSLVAGSSYQLLPVAFENPLWSRGFAKAHLALHVIGVPLMIHGFAVWQLHAIATGGTLVLTGLGLYAFNVMVTALRPFRLTPTSAGVLTALVSLICALTVAVWIVLSKFAVAPARDPLALLGTHTYLMLGGFFILLLAAVSYTLLPMFLLVPLASARRSYASIGYMAVGALIFVPAQLVWPVLLPFGALSFILGAALYVLETRALIAASPRRLDGALRLFATNLIFLVPVAALLLCRGLQLAGHMPVFSRQLDTPLFALAVFGTLTCAILGMGAKIVPFLVWQHRYAPLLGRARVPRLNDLMLPRVLTVLAWTVPLAAVVLATGSLTGNEATVRLGAFCLLGSIAGFFANLVRVLSHLRTSAAVLFAPATAAKPATSSP